MLFTHSPLYLHYRINIDFSDMVYLDEDLTAIFPHFGVIGDELVLFSPLTKKEYRVNVGVVEVYGTSARYEVYLDGETLDNGIYEYTLRSSDTGYERCVGLLQYGEFEPESVGYKNDKQFKTYNM